VVKLYPHSVGMDRFRSLVASLAHGTHLELGADLLKFALLLLPSGRAASAGSAIPAAAMSRHSSGFLADIAEPELLRLVHAQLRAYKGMNSKTRDVLRCRRFILVTILSLSTRPTQT
jgi:hypothetical protein